MISLGMLKEGQKMSDIFFHMDITLIDDSILQGGEWPSVPWYPDTPITGAATQDLSWFIEIGCAIFPRVCAIKDFPYLGRLHLVHHIKFHTSTYFQSGVCMSNTHYQQNEACVP